MRLACGRQQGVRAGAWVAPTHPWSLVTEETPSHGAGESRFPGARPSGALPALPESGLGLQPKARSSGKSSPGGRGALGPAPWAQLSGGAHAHLLTHEQRQALCKAILRAGRVVHSPLTLHELPKLWLGFEDGAGVTGGHPTDTCTALQPTAWSTVSSGLTHHRGLVTEAGTQLCPPWGPGPSMRSSGCPACPELPVGFSLSPSGHPSAHLLRIFFTDFCSSPARWPVECLPVCVSSSTASCPPGSWCWVGAVRKLPVSQCSRRGASCGPRRRTGGPSREGPRPR